MKKTVMLLSNGLFILVPVMWGRQCSYWKIVMIENDQALLITGLINSTFDFKYYEV